VFKVCLFSIIVVELYSILRELDSIMATQQTTEGHDMRHLLEEEQAPPTSALLPEQDLLNDQKTEHPRTGLVVLLGILFFILFLAFNATQVSFLTFPT
jgi:hypothetical protein